MSRAWKTRIEQNQNFHLHLESYSPWSHCIINHGLKSRKYKCTIILFTFYTPLVVKTYTELYNLKCQVKKKKKKKKKKSNNSNNNFIIHASSQKSKIMHWQYEWFNLKYLKVCTGRIKICQVTRLTSVFYPRYQTFWLTFHLFTWCPRVGFFPLPRGLLHCRFVGLQSWRITYLYPKRNYRKFEESLYTWQCV